MSAKQFAGNIAKALRGEAVHDEQLMNFSIMKEMHWTWQELMGTPLHVILSISFFHDRENAYNNLQILKGQKEKK